MNESKESGKRITREELFEAVWSTPISKLASSWNVSSYRIVQACEELRVPRPDPGHWSLVHRGLQFERPSLPPAEASTPAEAILKATQNQVAVESTVQTPAVDKTEGATQIKVPVDLNNAHHLVRQTRRALTARSRRIRKGMVEPGDEDLPLKVYVSQGQVDRALRILDAIVKSVVKRGGRFERGPEPWRLRLFLGKQPVEFRMTEGMKRREREYTAEDRTAKDFWFREKCDWHGSGILRFRIERGEDLREKTWEESKGSTLEDKVDEIVDALANVEETAKQVRADRAAQRKAEAERHDLEMERWRRELAEQKNREVLEQMAEKWTRAKRLRSFIRTCEKVLKNEGAKELPADGWELKWLAWARGHADGMDPISNGYLKAERERLCTSAS